MYICVCLYVYIHICMHACALICMLHIYVLIRCMNDESVQVEELVHESMSAM